MLFELVQASSIYPLVAILVDTVRNEGVKMVESIGPSLMCR